MFSKWFKKLTLNYWKKARESSSKSYPKSDLGIWTYWCWLSSGSDELHSLFKVYIIYTFFFFVTLPGSSNILFWSLKYHRLHPEYIFERIKQLQGKYILRVILCVVDIVWKKQKKTKKNYELTSSYFKRMITNNLSEN